MGAQSPIFLPVVSPMSPINFPQFSACVSHVSHKFIRNGMKFLIMGYLCSLMGKVLKIWETWETWQFPAVFTGDIRETYGRQTGDIKFPHGHGETFAHTFT